MTMSQLWSWLRRWPAWVQIVAWILAWPAVAALLIAARSRGAVGRAVAVAVLLVGGSVWFGAFLVAIAEESSVTAPVGSERPASAASDRQRTATPTPAEDRATAPVPPRGVPAGIQPAVVERVVDGDTIWVRVDSAVAGETMPSGASSKVRLLEIDAPESGSRSECGGGRATAFVRRVVPVGTDVWLQSDVEDTDRYGRFLRYVWLADGRMLNSLIVRRGWAGAVLYEPNDLHWRRMRSAERHARRDGRGIWGPHCTR